MYRWLVFIASFFNKKAKLAIHERKKSLQDLFQRLDGNTAAIAWFHSASLGEFEQGLPVMLAYKKRYPTRKLLVTFYSPSGYQHRKEHPVADFTAYLPWDSAANAKQFIAHVKPVDVFFIKYEFWYFFLRTIHEEKIPLFSISARFVQSHPFFQWYGGLHRKMLGYFDHLFVQNEGSLTLLASIGYRNTSISGDTRFDNVMEKAQEVDSIQKIKEFKGDGELLIIGSAWAEDMLVLSNFLHNKAAHLKVLIAPHDISANNRTRIIKHIDQGYCLFSDEEASNSDFMVLDTIGHLSAAYQYADLAFIGGAFGQGLHNILEATAFGVPVVFGNKGLEKFPEAGELISSQGAFSVSNEKEATFILDKLYRDHSFRQKTKQICLAYMKENQGATDTIMHYLEESR